VKPWADRLRRRAPHRRTEAGPGTTVIDTRDAADPHHRPQSRLHHRWALGLHRLQRRPPTKPPTSPRSSSKSPPTASPAAPSSPGVLHRVCSALPDCALKDQGRRRLGPACGRHLRRRPPRAGSRVPIGQHALDGDPRRSRRSSQL